MKLESILFPLKFLILVLAISATVDCASTKRRAATGDPSANSPWTNDDRPGQPAIEPQSDRESAPSEITDDEPVYDEPNTDEAVEAEEPTESEEW